jgi:3-deoxy-D-manno-octulosonate 8-phosphate phosphatase (KDO 8-P phosphatase)
MSPVANSTPISTASPRFAPEALQRAQGIRLLILDVDGVLTDGGLYFSEQGESLKRFSVLDGQGIKLLQQAGVQLAIITGRDSAALRQRLSALSITHIAYGVHEKKIVADQLLQTLALSWSEVAVMGDDWPDLPLLHQAQLACAPANAHFENRALAHWVSNSSGGHGAVRELCDLILIAQGHYARLLQVSLQP